jgi:hypothetical protein
VGWLDVGAGLGVGIATTAAAVPDPPPGGVVVPPVDGKVRSSSISQIGSNFEFMTDLLKG